jgi:DNA invertase Pin-like site-specific DNA recombinase
VFYVRVSTDEQAEHGTSLESQKERLTKLSELNEWQVVATYSDEGVSGRTTDRPGLLKVQEAIHSGICDIVAVTAIDRLSRTLRDLLNILDEMEDSEVVFHSIREGLDTSTLMGKFGVHMMGAVAELEHGLIAERTKDGRAKRRRQGRLSSGKPTYGYRADDNGHPEIVPDQADVVRLMYDLRANGDGIRAIRREFLARAILSPFGKPRWSESQIHRILSEPAYIGKHDSPVKYPAIIEDAIGGEQGPSLSVIEAVAPGRSGRSRGRSLARLAPYLVGDSRSIQAAEDHADITAVTETTIPSITPTMGDLARSCASPQMSWSDWHSER